VLVVAGPAGWVPVVVKAPFAASMGSVVTMLSKNDVKETVPRKGWNLRPPDRKTSRLPTAPRRPGPGEDDPAPAEFTRRSRPIAPNASPRRCAGFEALAARDDGWLLAPEARTRPRAGPGRARTA
jgi:hypothetical protein